MVNLIFSGELNISVQKGDFVFATPITSQSGYDVPAGSFTGTNVFVGIVDSVDRPSFTIVVDNSSTGIVPSSGDYISFAKSNQVNANSLKGYFAEVTFTNDARRKAELFTVGAEIQQSSK